LTRGINIYYYKIITIIIISEFIEQKVAE